MERLVRSEGVVLRAPGVEAPLRGAAGRAGWAGGVPLERAMHPFVAAVLLRGRRPDEIGKDPQSDPPDRQRGQPAERLRGERHAVVRPDALRGARTPETPVGSSGDFRRIACR